MLILSDFFTIPNFFGEEIDSELISCIAVEVKIELVLESRLSPIFFA